MNLVCSVLNDFDVKREKTSARVIHKGSKHFEFLLPPRHPNKTAPSPNRKGWLDDGTVWRAYDRAGHQPQRRSPRNNRTRLKIQKIRVNAAFGFNPSIGSARTIIHGWCHVRGWIEFSPRRHPVRYVPSSFARAVPLQTVRRSSHRRRSIYFCVLHFR